MASSVETLLAQAPLPDGTYPDAQLILQGRRYMGDIIRNERKGMLAHRIGGQLTEHRTNSGRDYRGAVRHSVLQSARFQASARRFGIGSEVAAKGRTAALIHDGGKLDEYLALRADGYDPKAYLRSGDRYHQRLRTMGFDRDTVKIAGSVGHESIGVMEGLLASPRWTELDTARALMFTLDNHARHDQWAEGIIFGDDGRPLNQLDRRMAQNADNSLYDGINMAGHDLYGCSTYEQQGITGHRVEDRLAFIANQATGIEIDGLLLPTAVDGWLLDDIRAVQL